MVVRMSEQEESGLTMQTCIYRCTECGAQSLSIGKLHAHIEKHRGLFGIQWPWNVGDADELMDYTEIILLEEIDRHEPGDEAREYVNQFEVTKIVE